MSVINRRNAVLGWTVWQVGKRLAMHKARQAAPGVDGEPKKKSRKLAIAAGLAAVGAIVFFWRKQGPGDEGPPPPPV